MMEQIENPMVVESEWRNQKEVEEVLKEPGYHSIIGNIFVSESESYQYALERCLNGTEEDIKEFKDMLVEWFYSGNWIKEGDISGK
jgi:hypothetical protein